jgi:isoleucyl-tRNA synthetase
MISLRPDWSLSRQRYWGVPIPAFSCENCAKELLVPEVIDAFADKVAHEGSDVWFTKDIQEFLPSGFKCPDCQGEKFIKNTDILDVWFDSGVSHQAVLKKRQELDYPCELYLEGSDQHRGWFQSSLIPAMCIDGKAPFKNVLTHGHVVDGEGRKMSKSGGNVIHPQDIIKDYGADILRLWVASSDYNEDIRISKEMLTRLSEAYRKIRNTARFILSNLYDFDPEINKVKYENLRKIDKWILFRLEWVLDFVNKAYDNFEFYKAYKGIYDFCKEDLSMYYLDMVKGRLYTYTADSAQRRSAQTAVYEILNVLVRIAAPILVFTAEEIWQDMPKTKEDAAIQSVHLSGFPKVNVTFAQHDLESQGAKNIDIELKDIIELIPDVAKALEEKRGKQEIGSSFDAQIKMLTNSEIRYKYLESLREELPEIFKVSRVVIEKIEKIDASQASTRYPDVAISVEKAEGQKCVRCWNYSTSIGQSPDHPVLCVRCLAAVREEK